MAFISKTASALNVEIFGTSGSFAVSKKGEESGSIEVRYLLTHVALGSGGHQQLLDMLAPVREVFDLEQLGFDEIMQRDIDDTRVSLDLIPYLLDNRNAGLVKLFPPIVVVVLPLKDTSRKPSSKYFAVSKASEPEPTSEGFTWKVTTAGRVGNEQFQMRELVRPDGTTDFSNSVLKLARENCALAIVDGQHRAMALLALYRNLKAAWSDARRAIYQQYYRVWPAEEIAGYDLHELQMPMIVCTFPQLDESYSGDMDVIKAARRVFLDLNKNAKKVSESRNRLLDDQDMVSHCLRAVLANVKGYDERSKSTLRIWNIELDQANDRSVISSPIALTGVSHLYYIAEHLLFYSGRVKDIAARRTPSWLYKKLEEAYSRLDLKDELTSNEQVENNRNNFSDRVADLVGRRWCARYGTVLEKILSDFHPFAAHCKASLSLDTRLRAENNSRLRALIFDGQSSARTFESFNERLDRKMADDGDWRTPAMDAIKEGVEAQLTELKKEVAAFKTERTAEFFKPVRGPNSTAITRPEGLAKLRDLTNELYQSVYTSIAFQAAIVLTLIEMYEAAYDATKVKPYAITEQDVDAYLGSLHHLFKPASFDAVVRLIAVFFGKLAVNGDVLEVAPTNWTFPRFVVSGEMKPDEWPKYRYLVLELWNSDVSAIQAQIDADIAEARKSVIRSAYKRALASYCNTKGVLEQNVSAAEKLEVLKSEVTNFGQLLENLKRKKVDLSQIAEVVQSELVVLTADDSVEGIGEQT